MPSDPMRWLSADVEDIDTRALIFEWMLDPDSAEFLELIGCATGNWNTSRATVTELCEMVAKLLGRR